MVTKWKKSKSVFSFTAFAAGLTMMVINLAPAVGMTAAYGIDVFEGQPDYQESEEFRYLISERLSMLMGVAAWGKNDSGNGADGTDAKSRAGQEVNNRPLQEAVAVQEETVVEEAVDYAAAAAAEFWDNVEGPEAFGGDWDAYQQYLEEQQAYYDEMMNEYGYVGSGGYDDYYGSYFYGYDFGDQESLDQYMADMAKDKNLRYAVICQNKLLYSNMEGFAEKAGQEWNGEDFSQTLDGEAYNFILWYNKENDGKVQIAKDGMEENVYGDGIYSDNSRWRVPGYANFTIGESFGDVVVFLAAAKNPQLYMVREDGSSRVTQYGGRLSYIRQNMVYLQNAAWRAVFFMTAAAILLAIAFLMRKSRRQAVERIADFLRIICLEVKVLLLPFLMILLAGKSAGPFLRLARWCMYGFSYYNWGGDYIYEIARLTEAGVYLAVWFWLIYLVALDFRMNRGRQKRPLFDLLKVKDFKYPIQKRLVRRQQRTLIAELSLSILFAAVLCAVWLFMEEYTTYLTGGYNYSYVYDAYEGAAQELGYPLGLAGFYMAYLMMPGFVFAALCTFTMITFIGLRKNYRLAVDIGALADQILAVREGSLTEALVLSEDSDLREAADNLNQIQRGMETALAEQVKSERMKVDLVTNVSHDIKTPLTSIISYAELLRQEKELPQHVNEYIQILGEKAERLRGIVQDVFEISKATSGQLPMQMEVLDMGKLLRQTLADMNDQISQSTLVMRTAIPETSVEVTADGQRLYRVFQNLLQNALRYSLEGSRVYLSLTEEAGQAVVRIKNTSGMELTASKDFTERFVRGDESRTDGGSGLGLSIAKSFTEACGGSLTVETDADLFTVTVTFPVSGQVQAKDKVAPGTTEGQGKEAIQDSEKPVTPEEVESV